MSKKMSYKEQAEFLEKRVYDLEDQWMKRPVRVEEIDFEDLRAGNLIILKRNNGEFVSYDNHNGYESIYNIEEIGTTWLHKHRYIIVDTFGRCYQHKWKGKVKVLVLRVVRK